MRASTPKAVSFQVNPKLYLVQQEASTAAAKVAPVKPAITHHVVELDVSGSMYGVIRQMATLLKAKLRTLLGPDDVISIVAFSGRGEHYLVLDAVAVATLADLAKVNEAIDRWIRCIGLTGFKEPIERAAKLVQDWRKANPSGAVNFIFMSDGYDNQWTPHDIMWAVDLLASAGVNSATVVEFGDYADRSRLTAIAERLGGAVVHARDFTTYEPIFQAAIGKRPAGGARMHVEVVGTPVGGFVYALVDGELLTFAVDACTVAVSPDLAAFYYLSTTPVGTVAPMTLADIAHTASTKGWIAPSDAIKNGPVLAAAYGGAAQFAQRMNADIVLALLKEIGDLRLIVEFGSCFGGQMYGDFVRECTAAANGKGRFVKGYDPKAVPPEDAFCLMTLLPMLTEDDGNRFLPDNPAFHYNKIGVARVDANTAYTAAEQKEIDDIAAKLAAKPKPKLADAKALQARLAEINASKKEPLKFEAFPAPDGYPVSALKLSSERCNVSMLIRREGAINVTGQLPAELVGKLPPVIKTNTWRAYAMIKDGRANIDALPLRVTEKVWGVLHGAGLVPHAKYDAANAEVVLNLRTIPVINRKMVAKVSAKELFTAEYELAEAKAAQKVYNDYRNRLFPKASEAFTAAYGPEATAWLKDVGITERNGFSPPSTSGESTDVYMARELKVKIEGVADSLPAVKDVLAKIASGKAQTGAGLLMVDAVRACELAVAPYNAALAALTAHKVDDAKLATLKADVARETAVLKPWLENVADASVARARALMYTIAQLKFAIIVGQGWFCDLAPDETKMTFTPHGKNGPTVTCEVTSKLVEEKI